MNCLLIGGAGFIGSNIIAHLSCNIDSRISILEPTLVPLHRLTGTSVTIHRGELADLDYLKTIIIEDHIDTIIHLVSTIIPGSNFDDYQQEFANVIFPTIKLIEFCCERDIRFVYISSGGTVYGNRKDKAVPFIESCPMEPISYYGWSKQIMENSIQYMHRTQGLRYLTIRPSNPYGRGQKLYGKQGIIAVALGKILAGEKVQIWGDGSTVRDFIYIDDLGKAIAELITNVRIINTTINIGSGDGHSINEIIAILKEIVTEDIQVEYIEPRQTDVSSVILDTTKLKSLIDFHPISLREGIKRFYQDLKNGKS